MRRQRNTAQMKEQIRTPEKELNKMEISNLSDAEFKTMFIKMLKDLIEDLSTIKNIQSETKDTLVEIKNNLQGNNVEWMNLRVKSMIWNTKKQKPTNQKNNKKKEYIKMRIV